MKRWGLILLVGILGTYASARTATHYADWLSGSFFYPAMERDEAVHLVAGPAARWLPGVLATVPPSEAVVYLADGMAEADWLAAYYLYPRRLHVRSAALASVPRDLRSEARELGAGWLLHRGVLFSLPDLKSVRPAQGDATGFPPAPPSVRGFLALLLTALCSLGWGAFLFGRLPMPGLLKRTPLTGRLGLALLAGLAVLGAGGCFAALIGLAGHAFLVWALTLAGIILLPLSASWLRPSTEPEYGKGIAARHETIPLWLGTWLCRGLPVLLVGLALAPTARALLEPMHHWDERFQWAYKAKILLDEGGIRGPTFQELDRPHLHRRYPLLVPALEAHLARLAGGFSQERAIKGLFPLFFVAMLLVAHAVFRTRVGPATALLLTTLLAALPPFHHASRSQGGPVHTGFADLPLAAFLTAAVLLLLLLLLLENDRTPPEAVRARGLGIGIGLLAGATFLTKPEGVATLLSILLVCALARMRRPQATPAASLLTALVVAAVLAVPRLALEGMVPTTGSVGYTGGEDYISRLNPADLRDGLRENLVPALTAMAAAPFTSRWAFFGLLPLVGLFASGSLPRSHLLSLVVLGPLAADLLAYVVTGFQVQWHLSVSLDRLWMQVVTPVFVLVADRMALPGGEQSGSRG